MEEHDNKKRTAVWLTPGVIRRMDSWLEEDNCKTRSEFIEKALRFYMGYLAAEDTSEYLSRALVDTLRGTLADNENRLRTLLFKLCVEVNMMSHTVAAHFRADPVNRRELRAYAVDEVLRTNGKISFDDALEVLRGEHSGQPATKKQQAYIQRLLRDFPGAEELLEYEDYQNAPTQGHANAFIRQVQEDFAEPMSRMENYLD